MRPGSGRDGGRRVAAVSGRFRAARWVGWVHRRRLQMSPRLSPQARETESLCLLSCRPSLLCFLRRNSFPVCLYYDWSTHAHGTTTVALLHCRRSGTFRLATPLCPKFPARSPRPLHASRPRHPPRPEPFVHGASRRLARSCTSGQHAPRRSALPFSPSHFASRYVCRVCPRRARAARPAARSPLFRLHQHRLRIAASKPFRSIRLLASERQGLSGTFD